jgi:hypothetical protein
MISIRKVIGYVFVAAAVVAALTPVSVGLLWAIFVPLLVVIRTMTIGWSDRQPERNDVPLCIYVPVIASRPPPSLILPLS